MKLLLIFTFLGLACIARAAPSSPIKDRVLILPDYHNDDEHEQRSDHDLDDQLNTTTTRRSTYIFPTKTRNTESPRRPWLTLRTTSTRKTTTFNTDTFDSYFEDDGISKYFKNVGQFFKKILEEIKKFIRNISLQDIIKAIQRYFTQRDDN